MSLTQVLGALLIVSIIPLLGGLPLIDWITYGLSGKRLNQLGKGNISISAAFIHGGKPIGILCVLSEALKGIVAVLLARYFFPNDSVWEILSLIALVMGRYWASRGAGTTNVFWGMLTHDALGAILVLLIGGGSFTLFRDRKLGRLIILGLLVFILSVRHPQGAYFLAILCLAAIEAWIWQTIPDDLDTPEANVNLESKNLFRFFRGDSALKSLNDPLDPNKVGNKAANLAYLKSLGYAVPAGWLFFAGDDPQPLIETAAPSPQQPLVVRSSAIGEDGEFASAAGQYLSILNVVDADGLQMAIDDCLAAYDRPWAIQYRRDRQQTETAMVVLVQKQIQGVFSGVAFSRDPVHPLSGMICIETLPGEANRVVSGQFTPERYTVAIQDSEITVTSDRLGGNVPRSLIESVARLARGLEDRFHGIPQDIEWTYDGTQLWLLQARAIATLQPIWTRKIAAEVIPGVIRPLPWSINRPLTCGVWGEIFGLVLGKKAQDLDFNETATLHFQRAYFNATLLGQTFRRMGLPPESLEFLTRGTKFSKPSLLVTLGNSQGLSRLIGREWQLISDFKKDDQLLFKPVLAQLKAQTLDKLSETEILDRINTILSALRIATYYSILAPLSFALRQGILKIAPETLNNRFSPEIASLRGLESIALQIRAVLSPVPENIETFKALLSQHPQGAGILSQFEQWRDRYGYLSETATDISIPRWREDPELGWHSLWQICLAPQLKTSPNRASSSPASWQKRQVQQRVNLKGQVTEVYSQLLAHLRWSFLALGQRWTERNLLETFKDIFWLEFSEIEQYIQQFHSGYKDSGREVIAQKIQQRRSQFEQNQALNPIPFIVYGNPTADQLVDRQSDRASQSNQSAQSATEQLQGIGASPGIVEGHIRVLTRLEWLIDIDKTTILVVPYTDSGWTTLISRAGGIIAEVGGSLSHGAIVAREYGIPAVMDIPHATQRLREGQRIRLDGRQGIIEILD
jgi:pyruvate,water dikinase